MKKIGLTSVAILFMAGALFAKELAVEESADTVVPYRDGIAADGSEIIFSNLTPSPDNLYNSDPDEALVLAGKDAPGTSELWFAVQFTAKVDVRAKVLEAAVGYTSGARRIKLGLYTNDRFTDSVGRLVQGGEGSTSQIPDLGQCCQLARVTLPGAGAKLRGKKRYWLVARSDDVNAPTFLGGWHLSNVAQASTFLSSGVWIIGPSAWPAGQIRGMQVQSADPGESAEVDITEDDQAIIPAANVTIFTNLGPAPSNLYNAGGGFYVAGNNAADVSELWEAVPFTVTVAAHAKTLAAAIGYVSGTKKVNLSIYSDNAGTVGTPLPGGQGSTTQIPDWDVCCDLARVTLPGPGVALAAGGHYWLIVSPDDVDAPDFEGLWQMSNLALTAFRYPEDFGNWISASGLWLAAEIRGTNP